MARTIDHNTADQGKKGSGPRWAAGLAAGALLGTALLAGTFLGQGRLASRPAGPPAVSYPVASDPHVYTVWDFREDHRTLLPESASTSAEFRWDFGAGYTVAPSNFVPDPFTYREDHRNPASTLDWEQVERGQVAPAQPAVIMGETPCPLGGTAPCGLTGTFGMAPTSAHESHGLDVPPALGVGTHGTGPADEYGQAVNSTGMVAVTGFVPDPFTYREDHRGSASAAGGAPTGSDFGWAIYDGTRPGFLELSPGESPLRPAIALVLPRISPYDEFGQPYVGSAAGDGGTPPGRLPFEYYA